MREKERERESEENEENGGEREREERARETYPPPIINTSNSCSLLLRFSIVSARLLILSFPIGVSEREEEERSEGCSLTDVKA